jgi:putative membrane protein
MHRPLTLLFALATAGSLHAQTTPTLTDPQVAHVAVTANGIDSAAAKFALTRTTNDQVKSFAQTMITDHSAVDAQAVALVTRLHVTPADNAVSRSLKSGAAQAHARLVPLHGAAFDKAYMDREVAYHQAVLDAIDHTLIPASQNADLKKLLTDVRPAIAAHLAHARELRQSLGA